LASVGCGIINPESKIKKDDFNNLLNIKYIKKLSNSKFLVGFKINIWYSVLSQDIKLFCEYLNDNENCDFVIKFGDKYLFNSLQEYYKEIFFIEMQLREIFSYIFISTYETDCFSFLEFQRQKINPLYKGVKEDKIPNFLKNKYQNEFFYLTFSQYRQLKLPDIIKSETLINLLTDNKTFDGLKKNIQKLGVLNPKKNEFLEFLNRISENLESVETIRNCVAHNREPTDEELGNYKIAKSNLEKDISDFFKEIKIKNVVLATIYLEQVGENIGVYRQNSTTLEFEDGNEEEIDFGDMEFFGDSGVEDSYNEFRKELFNYLTENFYNFDEENIYVNFEGFTD